jgi:polynucleotide 5'-triphosphatase
MTRDEKSGAIVECVKKIRLGDLNVYSPKRNADWRVSVNVECPGTFPPPLLPTQKAHGYSCVVQPPQSEATRIRRKDRLSYSHEEMVIDLTQVTSLGSSGVRLFPPSPTTRCKALTFSFRIRKPSTNLKSKLLAQIYCWD